MPRTVLSRPFYGVTPFRVRRGLGTDREALRLLIELGLSADQASREAPAPAAPQEPPVLWPELLPAWLRLPHRHRRAIARAARLMLEAAAYGECPLPFALQEKLRRCAGEVERLRKSRPPGRPRTW